MRIDRDTRWADVRAAVHRGITGIVFPGPEEPAEVAELGELIAAMEKERGVDPGTTELVLMLESAKGFWNAATLAQASPRVTALGVGRIDLTMRLGPVPQGEFRLYRFLMTRALVAARMLGKQPLGALWRPGSRGGVASREASAKAAREAMTDGLYRMSLRNSGTGGIGECRIYRPRNVAGNAAPLKTINWRETDAQVHTPFVVCPVR